VAVPKAAMNKDHFATTRKHQVGLARQIGTMEAETVT